MADVLSIIRDYTIKNKEIIEKDDDVIFGDFAYPKSTKTNYIIWGTNRPDSSKDYYTLECILYLLRNVRHNHAQYVRTAAAAGVPVVRLPDRRDLLNYLTGKTSTSDKIDRSAPLDMAAQRPVAAASAAVSSAEASAVSVSQPVVATVETPSAMVDLDSTPIAAESVGLDADVSSVAPDLSEPSLAKRPRLASSTGEFISESIDDSMTGDGGLRSTTAAPSTPSIASSASAGTTAASAGVLSEADQQAAVNRAMKERERLAAKLDETSAGGVGLPAVLPKVFESSSLSQVMSLAKIRALRIKRQVKIRDSIKPGDSAAVGGSGVATAGAEGTLAGATAISGFFSEDLNLLRDLVSRERLHRDRNSCLQAATRNFADSVLTILRAVRSREEGAANASVLASGGHHHQNQHQHSRQSIGGGPLNSSHSNQQRQTQQHVAYNRYDQEKFANRDEAAAYFKIDTVGSWGIEVLGRGPTGAGGGDGGPGSVARPSDPRRMQQQRQSFGSATPRTPVPQSPLVGQSGGSTPSSQQKRTSRTPIIIIPATASLISMLNAKDILLEKRFVSVEDKRASGARRENEALIQRMRPDGTTTVPFRVVDQPQKLTPDEWQRVVAVFVQGPAWQFKNWPIGGGNPVEIFAKVKAFHLKFADMPTDPNVLKWNVTVLPLDRHKRHLDKAVLQQFWDVLDLYMRKHKSNLRF